MLHDLARGEAAASAALDVIATAAPDVVLVLDVDWDHELAGAEAMRAGLAERGHAFDHVVALPPNSGRASGFDLDGNGRLGEGRDALGYGRFTGDGGMVLLSRLPLGPVADLSGELWVDLFPEDAQLLPERAAALVPVATVGQWVVPVEIGAGLTLVTMNATTPVFDGPEDRNGRRNAAELTRVAALASKVVRPVVLGRANQDPADGEGRREALAALLAHQAVIDPEPRGNGGGGEDHSGDPALDTMAFDGIGPLRVDYVLPARGLGVLASGVIWPTPDDPFHETVETAGRGRLVWVDIRVPE
jgi:hypothetical protein